jgi:hypothetical protein
MVLHGAPLAAELEYDGFKLLDALLHDRHLIVDALSQGRDRARRDIRLVDRRFLQGAAIEFLSCYKNLALNLAQGTRWISGGALGDRRGLDVGRR